MTVQTHRVTAVDDIQADEGLVGVTTVIGRLCVDYKKCGQRPQVGEIMEVEENEIGWATAVWIGGRRYT